VQKEKRKDLSGIYNMVVAACNDVGRNSDESNIVTSLDRKHDYVHQNMTVHDISVLITTGLETYFKLEERGTVGVHFIKRVSLTS
jgi:Ribonuclease G/E